MTSTYTTNKHIEKPAYNDYATNATGWTSPVNADWDVIDAGFGGVLIKNPTGISAGTYALSISDYQNLIIVFGTSLTGTATLSGNLVYTVPAGVGGNWIVYNNTTGSYTLTMAQASGGGTSAVLPQGDRCLVYSDGTNFSVLVAATPGIFPGSDTQVIYNSSGTLTGSANLTFDGTTLIAASASDNIGNLRTVPANSQTANYTLIASDAGKYISITTGGVNIPTSIFTVGQTVSIYNNSSSNQNISAGSVTLILAGTASTGSRTLAQYGLATLLCVASNTFVITGAGVS